MIVREASVTAGRVLASRIVPVTVKLIVSLAVPAAQPFVAVFVLAAVIASRKTQMPGAPGSSSELTVIVAACADAFVPRVSAFPRHQSDPPGRTVAVSGLNSEFLEDDVRRGCDIVSRTSITWK